MTTYKNYNNLYDFLEATAPGTAAGNGNGIDVVNKPFAFNPSAVRTGTRLSNGYFDTNNSTTTLTRGFIRNLMVDMGEGQVNMPNIRCRFQFNPQDIEHSLEARRDMYLPILQDPAQLTQPMAGNASFAFELVFDRTMEVNSRVSKSVFTGDVSSPEEKIPDDSSAETVGVFHDLRILYSIIGTGLSQEVLDSQMQKTKLDLLSYADRNYSELNIQRGENGKFVAVKTTDENDDDDVVDPRSFELVEFLNNLNDPNHAASQNVSFMSNLNVGNSAFLTPQPCRVIFSPMFMVDGFVMSTRVLFTKFSSKMIPIQCKVFIQMQAVYIGFAKKTTFLTAGYDKQREENTDAQQTANQTLVDIEKILQKYMGNISVGYSSDVRILGDETTATAAYTTALANNKESSNEAWAGLVYQPIWLYGTKNFWYRRPSLGTPGASKNNMENDYDPSYRLQFNTPINTPHFMPGITVKLVNSKPDKEAIAKQVFEDFKDAGPSIKISIISRIYGPFNSSALGTSFVNAKFGPKATGYPSSDEYPAGVKLLGDYNVGPTISDKASWDAYADRPHDFLLRANPPSENLYNKSNQAKNSITPATLTSANVSVFSNLANKISTYVSNLSGTETQKLNANNVLNKLYRDSYNSPQENPNPTIDKSVDTNNMSVSSVYNSNIPDSLLKLVEEVHTLNSKYFVVITETSLKVTVSTVANAGSPPFAEVAERSADVVQGSMYGHKVTIRQNYPHAQGLVFGPIGSIL